MSRPLARASRLLRAIAVALAGSAITSGCGDVIGLSSSGGHRPPYVEISILERGPEPAIRGEPYSLKIQATESTGQEPVTTLEADLSRLPAGNDASLQVERGGAPIGTLHWTPRSEDRGIYFVKFVARSRGAEAHGEVMIRTAMPGPNVAPVVMAPDTVWVAVGETVSFTARAADGNDEAILWWYVDGSDWNKPLLPYFQYWIYPPLGVSYDSIATITVVATQHTSNDFVLTIRAANSLSGETTTTVRMLEPKAVPLRHEALCGSEHGESAISYSALLSRNCYGHPRKLPDDELRTR